ncbi:hypothetical protein CALVIDRAFT_594246 [Calocera viscosa TUFC12733]|uniref:Uncharacterized protein n=1 Tax=Calocera viscosa (strain TUFC12733) TaxID=1330018 RepID=A0A167S2X6_CALVF|nr:hypothetical protein CALVIDRAFT_594246 [Calocera viscosa TUFC12733]
MGYKSSPNARGGGADKNHPNAFHTRQTTTFPNSPSREDTRTMTLFHHHHHEEKKAEEHTDAQAPTAEASTAPAEAEHENKEHEHHHDHHLKEKAKHLVEDMLPANEMSML